MKCYLCLTEPDEENSVYLDLLYVSLKTARKNTTLELIVLYDGTETGRCYEILKEFNVKIIKHQFSHKQYLEKTYPQNYIREMCGRDIPYEKIAGTFMRFDIPFVEQEDDFVFYTDIDVMFLRDFSHENFEKPEYLAATTELEKDLETMTYFNAGILYLNVKQMRKISEQVYNSLKNGEKNKTGLFDQGYLNQLCFEKMTIMPLEFNWKPYWGYNKEAYIVHFHAMKPDGDIENSGFGMTKHTLYHSLRNHFQDINGYVYYLMQYYEVLGKDGKKWIADFISLVFTTIIDKYNKRTKKSKNMNKILWIIISLITLAKLATFLI